MIRDEEFRWSIIGLVSTGECHDHYHKLSLIFVRTCRVWSYSSHLPQCYLLSVMDTEDYSEGWGRVKIDTEEFAPGLGRLGIEEDSVTF